MHGEPISQYAYGKTKTGFARIFGVKHFDSICGFSRDLMPEVITAKLCVFVDNEIQLQFGLRLQQLMKLVTNIEPNF